MRGEQIYSPPSANGIYGTRDGSASDKGRSPDTSPKVTPEKEIVVPGGPGEIPAQIPDDHTIPDGNLIPDGSGMGPTNIQDPINPDEILTIRVQLILMILKIRILLLLLNLTMGVLLSLINLMMGFLLIQRNQTMGVLLIPMDLTMGTLMQKLKHSDSS